MPCGYTEICQIDLQKNKKLSLFVNGVAFLIAALMFVIMQCFVPISTMFSLEDGFLPYILRFAALLVFSVLYIILHELTHGVAMKLCGTKKVKYGFTGIYAFAGSTDYYAKKPYIFIALAPIVLFLVIFAILQALVPTEWIWIIYLLQITNCSGAAGDLYVTFKFFSLPSDILVKDHGTSMTVYKKE